MRKMAKIVKDQRVYKGAEQNTESYLVSKSWKNKRNPKRQGNTSQEKF